MINLLKKWHILHSWSKWSTINKAYGSYPWTGAGRYAFIQLTQQRTCSVCNKLETRNETL